MLGHLLQPPKAAAAVPGAPTRGAHSPGHPGTKPGGRDQAGSWPQQGAATSGKRPEPGTDTAAGSPSEGSACALQQLARPAPPAALWTLALCERDLRARGGFCRSSGQREGGGNWLWSQGHLGCSLSSDKMRDARPVLVQSWHTETPGTFRLGRRGQFRVRPHK